MSSPSIQPGGTYRHYKGGLYQVVGVGKMEATLEDVVAYRALEHESSIWVRPLLNFQEDVEVEGKTVPRFTFLHA